MILTTQLLEEMDEICDNVAILFDKHIIEQGDPESIRNKYNSASLNIVFNKIFTRPRSDSKDYIKPKEESKQEKEKSEEKESKTEKDKSEKEKDSKETKSDTKEEKSSKKDDKDEDGMSSILK